MRQECIWYLEPKDDFSNEVLCQELANRGLTNENLCRDEKPNRIRVGDFSLVSFVLRSEKFRNRFNILNRRGENGKLRDVTDLVKRWGKKN